MYITCMISMYDGLIVPLLFDLLPKDKSPSLGYKYGVRRVYYLNS